MLARLTGVVGALLLLAACSSSQPENAGGPASMGAMGPGAGYAPGSQQDLAATAGDRVFFMFDRSDISPEGQQILQRQADWLRRYPNVGVTIEGHCDERGTREYNLALGERRAQAVKNVLVALGIPASRLQTISYGKERPIVAGSDEQAYAQNRVAITTVH
jgi:peptidoglycan-associated lipoprotein